ncbi:HEAT repeat domain-containing protein, partial [Streptomyces aureus]|uniref:HEAT repeat domain-containing protein n=1 Tax=Streptomyces aureus TaxID=193461 RepID=UPI000A7DEAA1
SRARRRAAVRLAGDEPVTVGRYSDHRPPQVSAAEAVRRVADAADCRGWEVFLPRSVAPAEVRHIRSVRQVNGWRYRPDAHGTPPCLCFGCRDRGGYGARRLRERRPHPLDGPPPAPRVLLAQVEAAEARGDTTALREALRWYGMRRRAPLARLSRLARHDDPAVRIALAEAAASWSTPGVDLLLKELADDLDPGVREAALDALVR